MKHSGNMLKLGCIIWDPSGKGCEGQIGAGEKVSKEWSTKTGLGRGNGTKSYREWGASPREGDSWTRETSRGQAGPQ